MSLKCATNDVKSSIMLSVIKDIFRLFKYFRIHQYLSYFYFYFVWMISYVVAVSLVIEARSVYWCGRLFLSGSSASVLSSSVSSNFSLKAKLTYVLKQNYSEAILFPDNYCVILCLGYVSRSISLLCTCYSFPLSKLN